ncbi:uncharacterized protein PHACADRAFT_115930 [Phanerochaete carnosa HHB-10118-sp]|uniref:Fungal-type protein kinase domain-containing protein n=1 Tax=Phanerochaete carnosa (strain HHB-10118-sp) TaxID=650164 RepID=K5W1D4_PHACS|nr:uncharacterized protein PHACADRAFT_115930 [Phanerochaete carnosa HHB-10118-sp]EKM57668.1 hypothetical protein PHACADRAFT_115930 [Phanerochaete carnosa HHB-10118-sp]
MAAEYDAFCKDDPVHKAADHEEKLLSEIDSVTVELAGEEFKELVPGIDMDDEVAHDVKGFDTIDFSQLNSKTEDLRYSPLCDVFNSVAKVSDCKGRFSITATHCETKETDFRPDMALYPEDVPLAMEAYLRGIQEDDTNAARCAWAWMIIALEVKCKDEDAGYGFEVMSTDTDSRARIPLLRDTPKGRQSRAQFVKYACEIMQRQHRTHVYSIYIASSAVRFFRFDRAGCVVSAPIDLQSQFTLFRDITYRLLNLSPKDQGFDGTVSLASPDLLRTLRACRPKGKPALEQFIQDYLTPDKHLYPIYKITCPVISIGDAAQIAGVDDAGDPLPPEQRTYLVGKPITARSSPTGRCTRGYVALEVEMQRMVFLKDQWRATPRRPELDVYRRLHSRLQDEDREFFATPIAGGDVDNHRTGSQHFMQHFNISVRPAERVHTRLVTKEIGRPLETYRGSFELITFVTQALGAHALAWEVAGVLHHDVSPGNILINTDNNVAFLNDWDLAKYREDLLNGVSASEPAGGTWPFKSALALRYPFKPAEVADDIESFVYILLFMAMSFHFHEFSSLAPVGSSLEQQRAANARNESLAFRFYEVFHEAERSQGIYVGGFVKEMAIQAIRVPIKLDQLNGPSSLERVLQKAYKLLNRHYRRVDQTTLDQFSVAPKAGGPSRFAREKGFGQKKSPSHTARYAPDVFSRHPHLNRRAPPSSSGSSSGSAISNGSQRPLDKHDAMLQILQSAWFDEDGHPLDITDYLDDCLYDQCTNQPVMTSSRRKNFTGVVFAHVLAESLKSMTRKIDEGGSECSDRLRDIEEESEGDDAEGNNAGRSGLGASRPTARTRASRTAKDRKKTLKPKKITTPRKTTTSRRASPPRKAKAVMQVATARKATNARKLRTSRKSSASGAKALVPAHEAISKAKPATAATKTSAKPKARAAAAAPKITKASKAAATVATAMKPNERAAPARVAADKTMIRAGPVRRSARLATEQDGAPSPPTIGKRKRDDKAPDAEDAQLRTCTIQKRKTNTRDMHEIEPAVVQKPVARNATKSRKAAKAAPEAPARRSTRLAAKKA